MKIKHGLVIGILLVLFILALRVDAAVSGSFAGGYSPGFGGSTNNWQSYQPTFNQLYSSRGGGMAGIQDLWPILRDFETDQCEATSDFIIGIPPGGCTPGVVRSDLLADQSVPVFCQLYAIKINPLIKVSSIRSMTFKNYPEGVRSVVFHPARAAVRSYTTLLGDPTINNIGYVVIILKQNRVEANMEEWITGNLTATIRYDAEEAYGTRAGDYYLPVMSDDEWATDYAGSSFWLGRGYLRTQSIDRGSAKIQLLTSKNNVVKTFNLKEGETSSLTYLPGYYCRAGLKIKLNSLVAPEDKALLNIDGQTLWVRQGTKFLNNKCRVTKLNIRANNDGEIDIRCTGSEKISLSLKLRGAFFKVDEEEKEYLLGEFVDDIGGKKWYLAYVGNYPKNYDENEGEIAILISGTGDLSAKDSSEVYRAVDKLSDIDTKENGNFGSDLEKVGIKVLEGKKRKFWVVEVKDLFLGLANEGEMSYEGEIIDEYFKKSNEILNELIGEYGSEEKENGEMFGEEALYEQIILAGNLKKFKTQSGLINIFIDKYPSSKIIEQMEYQRQNLKGTNYDDSYVNVYVNDRFRSISVVDFKSIGEGDRKVDLRIGTIDKNGLEERDEELLKGSGKIIIEKILPGKVEITFDSDTKDVKTKKVTILEGQTETLGGKDVYVKNVIIDEVAHVSIIPDVKHTTTEADFTFKIGIEKRAIELSPERVRKMLKNLDETIQRWEDIVNRLGNVVKGLKGACFATSTFLMLKNMATGFSGKAAARQKVMAKYKVLCDTNYGSMSRTECYNKQYKQKIENDVTAMTTALQNVNKKMDKALEGNVGDSGGLFGGKGVTNQDKYLEALRGEITGESVKVKIGGVDVDVKKEDLSLSQLRAVLLNQELAGAGGTNSEVAKAEMDIALRYPALIAQQRESNKEASAVLQKAMGLKEDKLPKVQSFVGEGVTLLQWSGETAKDYDGKLGSLTLDGKKKIQFFNYNGQKRLFVLSEDTGNMNVEKEYKLNNGVWGVVSDSREKFGSKFTFSTAGTSGACSNRWSGDAKVSYYEYGNNKGLPAIVPFDKVNGWYAMIPNSGGTFLDNSPQGYTASADVRYFKICNVGSNRVMESGTGDDLCQSFDSNTIRVVDDFIPCRGLNSSQVRDLYNRAREAIRQASDQRDSCLGSGFGRRSISILNDEIGCGPPMSQVGGFECQDFMSPDDCRLMFNVCDPVICPPSRCDLGGKMPVSDVIQTGIIGSLVLCLPNAAEGILFPICLSGIHAGLDSYVSILKSEQDCLRQNLETGEHVGICDEITSIYKCEFFWRQLSPVMDQLLPSLVMGFVAPGERVRGGGEYALVQQSWNTMRKSVDYFKSVYAQNAFRAFNLRSTEEVGSTVCNAFVGTSFPGSADVIDSLLEPESPSQFYAQFSETLFTEATVPATSQYKVYYHIYAGNDVGVQYRVYLKNPPETSYYRSNPSIWVKSGYIARGDSADETIDFTAPAGYKELCVVINAKEECGFKQVTTDFGLNYIKKKYVEGQANKSDITSEKECISGTPSILSMANLNLQAGAEEIVNPEIAMRGIVRICASMNPGAGVDIAGDVECGTDDSANGCGKGFSCVGGYCEYKGARQKAGERWKDVGYCGEASFRCWLDTDSVKDDLRAISAIEGSSISLLDERRGLIDVGILNLEQVQERLASARSDIAGLLSSDLKTPISGKVLEITESLDKIIGTVDAPGSGTNVDRAEALALKASVYRLVVEQARIGGVVQQVHVANEDEKEEEPEKKVGGEDEGTDDELPIEEMLEIKKEGNQYKVYVNKEFNNYYFTTGDGGRTFFLYFSVGNLVNTVASYKGDVKSGVLTFVKIHHEDYNEKDISFFDGKIITYDSSTDTFSVS